MQISAVLAEYDVTPKEKHLAVYKDEMPEELKIYLVTRKIEGLSANTLKIYSLYLTDMFQTIGKDIKNIAANDIRIYLYKLQESRQIGNRALEQRRGAIETFFRWCVDNEYIEKNPCHTIKPIKYGHKERTALTEKEFEAVRDACLTLREKALIEFLASTACRVSELVGTDTKDISFEKGKLTVTGKGNKERKVYLKPRAQYALLNYLNSRNDDCEALFVSERNPHQRLKKEAVEKIVRKIGERVGIELFPHLIRHTAATIALDHGMPITEIQRMLGHNSISTTMLYAKANDASVKTNHQKYAV